MKATTAEPYTRNLRPQFAQQTCAPPTRELAALAERRGVPLALYRAGDLRLIRTPADLDALDALDQRGRHTAEGEPA